MRGPDWRSKSSLYMGLKPLTSVNRYPTSAEPWELKPPKVIGGTSQLSLFCARSNGDSARRPARSSGKWRLGFIRCLPSEPSSQKVWIQIRSVNRSVAASALAAGLEPHPAVRRAQLSVKSVMTLQAKLAAFTPHQQHAVGAAMRSVTGGAALHLHRRVFVQIRAALFGVTVHAGLKSRLVQTDLILRAVRIVAVAAFDQAFGHAMMHWQSKLRLHRAVAAEAQLGLGLL